jgi:hypothetical protein
VKDINASFNLLSASVVAAKLEGPANACVREAHTEFISLMIYIYSRIYGSSVFR